MTFFFGLLDIILTAILLFDTIGLAYQIRKEGKCEPKEYIRVCLSWILFLTICNLFTCNKSGFFGLLLRLIFFLAKAFVTIPKAYGTLRIYDYLVEKKNAENWYKKAVAMVQSKIGQGNKIPLSETNDSDNILNENSTPS